jgi:hypothetical protein
MEHTTVSGWGRDRGGGYATEGDHIHNDGDCPHIQHAATAHECQSKLFAHEHVCTYLFAHIAYSILHL